MIFSKIFKLDKVCARHPRHRLAFDHIQVENGVAVATDGHILAIVPVEMEEGDEPGLVPPRSWGIACKRSGSGEACIGLNGAVRAHGKDGLTECARPVGKFVTWTAVIPAGEPVRRVRLNAAHLARLAAALGDDMVTLELHDNGHVIGVRGHDKAHGLIYSAPVPVEAKEGVE